MVRGRARLAAVAAISGLAGLLAGCVAPDGIDRDLTGGWGPMPEPVGWLPAAAACHPEGYQPTSPLSAYQPGDCELLHATETGHVGEFTGDAADRVTPPPEGSPEWREAYAGCDDGTAEFLGGDFRNGMLWLGVSVPSAAAWEGGARWFRCELVGYDVHAGTFQDRQGSLAGALAGDSELRLGCHRSGDADDEGFLAEMQPVPCDQPHNAEYVGVWRAPNVPYLAPDDGDSEGRVHRGCREQVAGYVDVPVDGNLVFRTGTIATWMSEQDWENGDRGFRCYLWLDGVELDGSLRGAGTDGLPVR